jgi:hypothetical protein
VGCGGIFVVDYGCATHVDIYPVSLRASAMVVGSWHMIDTCHGVAQVLQKDRLSSANVTSEVRGKSVGNDWFGV